jgi:putative sigma-54 modulation protein
MRLELTGRHVDITPGLRRLIDTKLTKLDRLLNDRAVSAQCVLTLEKRRHCAEITLHARGEKFLHAVVAAGGWQAAVTATVAKLMHQAGTVKGKLQERKRQGRVKDEPIPAIPPVPLGTARKPARAATGRAAKAHIVQASRQPIKPMSIADATRQLHAGGDAVVIFRDLDTSSVNVLYRQANGELRLVETEA